MLPPRDYREEMTTPSFFAADSRWAKRSESPRFSRKHTALTGCYPRYPEIKSAASYKCHLLLVIIHNLLYTLPPNTKNFQESEESTNRSGRYRRNFYIPYETKLIWVVPAPPRSPQQQKSRRGRRHAGQPTRFGPNGLRIATAVTAAEATWGVVAQLHQDTRLPVDDVEPQLLGP